MSTAETKPSNPVHLVDPSFPRFLSGPALTTFPDLQILSIDGLAFEVNSALLASCVGVTSSSPARHPRTALQAALGTQSDLGLVTQISTQLRAAELQVFFDWVTYGTIPDGSLDMPDLRAAFRCFEVDLEKLQFQRVDQLGIPPPHCRELGSKRKRLPTPMSNEIDEAICFEDPEQKSSRLLKAEQDHSSNVKKDKLEYFELNDDTIEEDEFDIPTKGKRGRRNGLKEDFITLESAEDHGPGFITEGERDLSLKFQCPECLYGTNSSRSISQHKRR